MRDKVIKGVVVVGVALAIAQLLRPGDEAAPPRAAAPRAIATYVIDEASWGVPAPDPEEDEPGTGSSERSLQEEAAKTWQGLDIAVRAYR